MIHVTSTVANKWLRNDGFKYSWPVYGAHIIENCLKKHGIIPKEVMYQRFDPDSNTLVFSVPLSADLVMPTKIEKIKDWLRRKLV